MKTFTKIFQLSAMALCLSLFISCSDDDDGIEGPILPPQPDIVDQAIASGDLTNLIAALERANLTSTLRGDGPFTVFAPTDQAFLDFLTDNNFSSLEAIPEELLTQVLLNHVVAGEAFAADLSNGYLSSSSTAGPDDQNLSLYVDTSSGVVINGISTVVTADVDAANGVVHIVDKVIGLPNIVDHAVANPDLSELVGALTAGGNTTFTDLLSTDTVDYTVFAPVNAAFTAFTNPNGNDLSDILSNHVIVNAAAFSSGLSNSYVNTVATNSDGDNLSLYINTDNGVSLNGVANVAAADIVATNGVIHAVDAVIDIPTVVTFATADPNFSSLVTALTTATPATDFVGVLTGDGPFTVFAPTDVAFQNLLDTNSAWNSVEDIEESLLTAVLQHHVISGANIRSADLTPNGTTVTPATLEGDTFSIDLPGTNGNIADVTDGAGNTGIGITAVDVQAGNGVIHVLDAVLLPDTTN